MHANYGSVEIAFVPNAMHRISVDARALSCMDSLHPSIHSRSRRAWQPSCVLPRFLFVRTSALLAAQLSCLCWQSQRAYACTTLVSAIMCLPIGARAGTGALHWRARGSSSLSGTQWTLRDGLSRLGMEWFCRTPLCHQRLPQRPRPSNGGLSWTQGAAKT